MCFWKESERLPARLKYIHTCRIKINLINICKKYILIKKLKSCCLDVLILGSFHSILSVVEGEFRGTDLVMLK